MCLLLLLDVAVLPRALLVVFEPEVEVLRLSLVELELSLPALDFPLTEVDALDFLSVLEGFALEVLLSLVRTGLADFLLEFLVIELWLVFLSLARLVALLLALEILLLLLFVEAVFEVTPFSEIFFFASSVVAVVSANFRSRSASFSFCAALILGAGCLFTAALFSVVLCRSSVLCLSLGFLPSAYSYAS